MNVKCGWTFDSVTLLGEWKVIMNNFVSLQGQCAYYLPRKEEFIVFGLLMIEVESVEQKNGFCRRNLKITNTKVNQS